MYLPENEMVMIDNGDKCHEMMVQDDRGKSLFCFYVYTPKHPKEVFEKEIHPIKSGFLALTVP